MSELKLCSYCKSVPQANTWTLHGITETRYFCPNPDCPHSVRTVRLEQWNTRPLEDVLNKRIAELEAERRFIEHSPEEKPGHGIDVLLEVETIGFVVGFCINGDYLDDYWVQRGWEGVTELSENVGEKVLRWFELPEDK